MIASPTFPKKPCRQPGCPNLTHKIKTLLTKITRSKKSGLEIINQVVKAIQDNKTEIIAVIAPTLFDDQLMQTLLDLAKRFDKKIIFWDQDFMFRRAIGYEKKKLTQKAL